ncbi:NUDIX hydrolase [Natronosporangium hydrolyticum]|uniref:NUDIX hydrolase n=1 Tax=Natronosporangium hydrolyticum TaxID=2811111 RepID=A0A895YQE5_9ACTN|nr:NUDIX hydrolase [Natronosporangium hydrolyticum]QSB16208.1 NUDIX hydrolase [Natronosporangium hydrolyticum]
MRPTGPLATIRNRAAAVAYPVFYRLPRGLRRWLVRRVAPTYTVGAVVLLYDIDQAGDRTGQLLLLRQPGNRGWSLPAGLLDRGERPIDGAARELAEETGVELTTGQLTPATPNAVIHHHGRWVDVVFEAQAPATETTLRVDGAEVHDAAWHPLADLPPLSRATARLLAHYGISSPHTPLDPQPTSGQPDQPGPA